MYFAQGGEIKRLPLTHDGNLQPNKQIETVITGGIKIQDVDIDASSSRLYFADVGKKQIYRVNLAVLGSSGSLLITHILANPQGVSIDWQSKNVYWTDYQQNWIGVARSDGLYPKVLISGNMVEPRGIAVNARDG